MFVEVAGEKLVRGAGGGWLFASKPIVNSVNIFISEILFQQILIYS